jgi:hypothetical protein
MEAKKVFGQMKYPKAQQERGSSPFRRDEAVAEEQTFFFAFQTTCFKKKSYFSTQKTQLPIMKSSEATSYKLIERPIYGSSRVVFNTRQAVADITSASDYYPFGSPLDGRTFSSDKYRFGFNGQEKDGDDARADHKDACYAEDDVNGNVLVTDPTGAHGVLNNQIRN